MIELTTDDWYYVAGRGDVAAFGTSEQLPDDINNPVLLQGKAVKINGKEYTVKGVETFAIGLGKSGAYPRKLGFGLLVGER